MSKVAVQNKLDRFKRLLKAIKAERMGVDSPVFQKAVLWLQDVSAELKIAEKDELRLLVLETFQLTSEELLKYVVPAQQPQTSQASALEIERSLWELIPPTGFFRHYCEYTSRLETPLAFNLFSSMCIAGAVINRRLWFDMGYFKVFPNLSVVLIAPSGICHKTTGTNIAVGLLQKLGLVKVYSEKITPEALVEAMRESTTGLIYVPELTVFLGKQKYNVGMVQLLTRLLDNPDVFDTSTITRKQALLKDVGVSMLAGTILKEFVENTPEGTFGGGLMNRLVLVVQEDTPREEPRPRPPPDKGGELLQAQLAGFHAFSGEMSMQPATGDRWDGWYHDYKLLLKATGDDVLARYTQRRPERVLKTAMLLHLSEHPTTTICLDCLERAMKLAAWTEKFLPQTFKQMFRSVAGEEQAFVLRTIEKCTGLVDHSTLVQRVQYKMNAAQLKIVVRSLIEARQIKEIHDATAHYYILLERSEHE